MKGGKSVSGEGKKKKKNGNYGSLGRAAVNPETGELVAC